MNMGGTGGIGIDQILAKQSAGLLYGAPAEGPAVTVSQANYLVTPSMDSGATWYVPRVVSVQHDVPANRDVHWARNLDDNFHRAADIVNLDASLRTKLARAQQVVEVEIPFLEQDSSVRIIHGGRVLFSDILGPGQGGTRFVDGLALDDLWCLANDMVWKLAVHGCAAGGAKGGLDFDPTKVNPFQARRVAKAFMATLAPYIGREVDAMGPDMNTGPLMDDMQYAFSHHFDRWEPSIATGKPLLAGGWATFGGAPGRPQSTGYGVASAIEAAYGVSGKTLAGSSAVIQGAGQVGFFTAERLSSRGVRIIGIGDETENIFDSQGINISRLAQWLQSHEGKIAGFDHVESRSTGADALLTAECDILVPAAVQKQLTEDNAARIRAKLIAEGANSPTTTEADQILERRGILIIPDILANGRGVATSLMERQQNITERPLTRRDVEAVNHDAQLENVRRFLAAKTLYQTDARTAAMISALLFIQTQWRAAKTA